MNDLLQNIILHIKTNTKIDYQELDNIYHNYNGDKKIIPLTSEQINLVEEIYKISSNDTLGGNVYLRKENLYIDNVSNVYFSKFYASIIKILYQCGKLKDNLEAIAYIVDNRNIIYDNLNSDERKTFNHILNYKFSSIGYLSQNIISTFGYYFLQYILSNDVYEDIFYIDTDQIYFNNYIDTYNMIVEKSCGLFELEIENPSTYIFIQKKRYIEINDTSKIKGFKLVENKNIKNHNYKIYLETYNGKKLSYTTFNSRSMREFSTKYIEDYKHIYERREKLNRILND